MTKAPCCDAIPQQHSAQALDLLHGLGLDWLMARWQLQESATHSYRIIAVGQWSWIRLDLGCVLFKASKLGAQGHITRASAAVSTLHTLQPLLSSEAGRAHTSSGSP